VLTKEFFQKFTANLRWYTRFSLLFKREPTGKHPKGLSQQYIAYHKQTLYVFHPFRREHKSKLLLKIEMHINKKSYV